MTAVHADSGSQGTLVLLYRLLVAEASIQRTSIQRTPGSEAWLKT